MGFDLATAKPAEAGGFDLSTAKPVDSDPKAIPGNLPAAAPDAEPAPGWFERLRGGATGVGATLWNMGAGAVGQVGGTLGALAGQVRMGELGDPAAGARAAETAKDSAERFAFTPGTKTTTDTMEAIGRVFDQSKLAGLPMADMQLMSNLGRSAPAALQKTGAVGESGAQLVDKGIEKVASGGRSIVDVGRDLSASKAKQAGKEAGSAARGAVEGAAGELEKQASQDALRVKAMGDVRKRVEAGAQPPAAPASLDVQGGTIRQSFTEAMDTAKKDRAAVADIEFGQVKEIAAEKEAGGARVDTGAIEAALEESIAEASGITDLEAGLKKMLSAVREAEAKEGAAPKQPKAMGLLDEIQRKGGIEVKQILDITGEGRAGAGVRGLRPGLFKNGGRGLDELATDLRAEGWDIPHNTADGGVQALRDMIRDEIEGRPHYNLADQQRVFEQQQEARAASTRGEEAPKGKTFEQLELARRYLNDIGYSSDLEGYPAILRGQARKIATSIDKAMQDFVPEFGAYKDRYREMSEPLESLTTKFGKAVTGTEGGLAETAYSKVANADLPGRLFARKEGIDLLVDALAGGKNASSEARAAAQVRVDGMVENWALESVRQKTPTAALEHLSSPQMRGPMSAVPNVEAALKKKFGDIAGLEQTAEKMVEIGKELSGRADKTKAAAQKLRTSIDMADAVSALPGKGSQEAGYKGYVSALKQARKDGLVPQEAYEALMARIDRAETLQAKTDAARDLVKKVALYMGLPAVGAAAGVQFLVH